MRYTNKDEYIKAVLSYIGVGRKMKRRIREDLTERIEAAMDMDPFYDMFQEIGAPKDVAKEFMENLDIPDEFYGVSMGLSRRKQPYEYKSERKLFGIPLLHVNIGGRYLNKVAKGIIAIGDISIGFISIGGVSFGLISIGGISIGVFVLGGVAIGGFALGGVAIGLYSLGGIAYTLYKGFTLSLGSILIKTGIR